MHFFSSKVQSPAPRTRPHTIRFRALIGALFALLCLTLPAVNLHADETTAAETTIYNRAEATYADSTGLTFSIFSPTVSVTVRAVAMLAVTPDEAAPSASVTPRERITRLFQVCNTGNTADLYTLTGFTATAPAALVELRFDIDDSGTLTPADTLAALGSTMSPRVAPARCIGVLATLDTNDITQGSNLTLTLTARSNVQAIGAGAIDSGTIINTVGRPAQFTSPVDPTLQPLKLVEDQTRFTANQNQTLAYSIAFRNSGETIARNVVLRDPLPGNLTYVPGTLRLARTLTTNTNAVAKTLTDAEDSDEGTLRGATLELRLAEVAPAEIINLTFSARVTNSTPSSIGIVNTAELSASNASPIRSSDTIVIITPRGTIFAGRSGAPIAGANITLLDANLAAPVRTTPNIGNAPNEANDNPFASDANGNWSLVLTPDQLDQIGTQTTYRLRVAATNFRTRDLELTLTPTGGGLFTLTVRALDNQPISRFGSFELTTENVRADALSALAFNVPLFEASALELTKSVDKQNAEIGDTLSYRLEVQNRTSAALTALQIRDVLPRGFHYAEGTARIQSGATARPIEPQVTNQTLIFDLNSLAANSNATISYRVRIGADTAEGAASNTAIATATFPNGEPITTMQAVATVRVGRGVFSVRQVILGRVFDDVDGDNSFNAGDKPLAGVRLYLTNGQSATTDSQGMYNFPAVDDGALVISLDPITLPAGSQLLERDNNKRDRNSWTRLLRTPLGGGGLLRQNFAVRVNASAVADNIINSPRTANALVDDNDDAPNDAPQSGVARARDKGSSNAEISTLKSDVSNLAARRAGTYEEVSTEAVAIVAPGDVVVLNLTPDALVRTPALSVVARVAEGWTTQLKINNHPVPQENIGVQRQDHKNRVTTYEYVGIVLQPGANRVNIAAVSSAGKAATPKDFVVYGRAAARRMTIQPERSELRSDGRDATLLHIKLYDERGNPALDGTVTIEVSAGRLFAATFQNSSENPSVNSNDTNLTPTTTASNSASTSHRTGAKTSSSSTTNAPDRRNLETALTDNDANAIAVTDVPTRQMLIQTVDGEATVRLVAEGAPQKASIRSASGTLEAVSEIRFAPDVRPAILVGLAEASFGRAAPDNVLRGEDKAYRSHLSLFFRGKFLTDKNLLTLAYDSARPINRTTGASNRDRLFQLDPLDRVYPLFGDSSTRFDEARSNSKVYARLDRNRSFAQFGDFDTATVEPIAYSTRTQVDSATNFIANNALANANASAARLALYQRRLTGVQLHLENTRGDYVTLSGARPDTAWSRDIFQGGTLALIRLSHADMLLGSETVISETRDRRNPEIVIERTVLARSIDYNLDPLTGTIFFLRPTQSFDSQLNLVNTVVTYEHRADDYSSSVYTARAQTSSGIMRRLGLRAGVSAAVERRPEGFGNYTLGGIDIEKSLPRKGTARFEFATSRGTLDLSAGFLNTSLTPGDEALTRTVGQAANGNAFRFELTQPLGFYQATLRADYTRTGQGFFNPFGSTQAAGSSRAAVLFDMRPRASSTVRFSFTNERNQTANVDNSRTTVSALYTEQLNDKLRLGVGLDHREFNDTTNDKEVSSNLVTVGAEYRPTEKLEITAKREQNISDADPTYPDATTLTARYQINPAARLFFTQRLASAPIVPIADLVSTGFAGTGSRRETAVGIETQIGRATAVNGRYQIENGINGTDSFAVIGLTNRLSISKQFSLDTAFERGFLLAGNGESFTGGSFGLGWQAGDNFRSSARYEVRDRNGLGQIFTIGAAGKIGDDLTTLARFQMGRTTTDGGTRNGAAIEDRHNSVMQATAALAYRPLHNDRAALLFSYTHRSLEASGIAGREPVSDIADTLSADGLYQLRPDTEIYGRFALRRSADGRDDVAYVSTMTYMTQARLAQRIGSRFDVAGEARFLFQPVTSSYRESLGAEVGYWLLPDLRIGGGYNLTSLSGSATTSADNFFGARRGFYFTISSKLSNLFNLFGTSRAGLDGTTTPAATTAAAPEQQIERDGRQ
ncbi:MAG: hypothetical protein MSG64_13745 [Pyrinomonadaceae bacterium MAG19_C2-C3]|nr:hypothetical protein [Pyrinomonadaceae bacterium MAG19_C2-C3]